MQANLFNDYIDITSNYHNSNPASNAANVKVAPNKRAMKHHILALAKQHGGKTWVKQVIAELGFKHQTASARLTELKAAGMLVPTNERVEGCTVLEIVK